MSRASAKRPPDVAAIGDAIAQARVIAPAAQAISIISTGQVATAAQDCAAFFASKRTVKGSQT